MNEESFRDLVANARNGRSGVLGRDDLRCDRCGIGCSWDPWGGLRPRVGVESGWYGDGAHGRGDHRRMALMSPSLPPLAEALVPTALPHSLQTTPDLFYI